MNAAKYYLCIFLLLFITQAVIAQDSLTAPVTALPKKKTTFTIGTIYLPRLHYYGRTDSLKSTALAPNALLKFANGIYLSSTVIFLNNKQIPMQYGATIAGAGYRFGKTKGIAGSVYGDLFFYANKELVQSSQKGQAGYTLSYLNPVININNNSSVVFSDNNDLFTSLGVDHSFRFVSGKSVFVVIPAFNANGGTQNFTNSYYKTRYINGIPAGFEEVTETSKKFNLLSFEFSVPVVFVHNKLALSFTPGYVIPQSVINVPGRPDLSENATNLFYANAGVFYTFGKK
jgi:hypothetical protein